MKTMGYIFNDVDIFKDLVVVVSVTETSPAENPSNDSCEQNQLTDTQSSNARNPLYNVLFQPFAE